jgi:molybdopterin-guanine dinucleotide biosynthesis protein A
MVLAGGRSRRFGRDKALASLGPKPLIAWVVEALGRGADLVAVNGPAELGGTLGLPVVADAPDMPAGPLAGVLGGLAWAESLGFTHLFTAPCDTPFLPADLGARLKSEIGDRLVAAAKAERAHPLVALWSVAGAGPLRQRAASERQPAMMQTVLDLGVFVDFPDERVFANINTPEDMAAAQAALAAR